MNTDAEYLMWWKKVKNQFPPMSGRNNLTVAAARAAWLESERQMRERLTAWLVHHPTCTKIAARRSNVNWEKTKGTCTCGLDQAMEVDRG